MWIASEMTLSSEWNTSEFLQVAIALKTQWYEFLSAISLVSRRTRVRSVTYDPRLPRVKP